jgi:hypothetical protein
MFQKNNQRLCYCRKNNRVDIQAEKDEKELMRFLLKFMRYIDVVKKYDPDPLLSAPSKVAAKQIIDLYDTDSDAKITEADNRLFEAGLDKFVPQIVEAVPQIKSWKAGNSLLYSITDYGGNASVYALGVKCLTDRSYWVRIRACDIIGVSGKKEGAKLLEPMLFDKNKNVRFSARRAINAIGTGKRYNPHIISAGIKI